MGYTHSFRQKRSLSDTEWQAISDAFKQLQVIALLTKSFPIQREYDNSGPPKMTDKIISFNGIGDNRHETMVLDRNGRGFQFCKTARKPYDKAVMALLVLADHHAPDAWEISSDGGASEWQPTLTWMNSTGLGTFSLPEKVLGDDT